LGEPDEAGTRWNAEAARRDDTGLRFWAYVTTGPLTLLTLASLVVAWKTSGPERGWWLTAAMVVFADRLLTFSYFIPTMVGLMNAPDSPASASAAMRWMTLNYLRHALVLVGWLAALKAFSLLYRGTADPRAAVQLRLRRRQANGFSSAHVSTTSGRKTPIHQCHSPDRISEEYGGTFRK
jgi:hypothetical protein